MTAEVGYDLGLLRALLAPSRDRHDLVIEELDAVDRVARSQRDVREEPAVLMAME